MFIFVGLKKPHAGCAFILELGEVVNICNHGD
jgi:hypothetical protein